MSEIHASAVVDPKAEIGEGCVIGPFCLVGEKVKLGANSKLHSHVVIEGSTEIGESTEIYPFASIGHIPQDLKFGGENSQLIIGSHNRIREHVTMNPGTEGGGMITRVGSHGLFMAGSHVAHDCVVGDHVILANNATLAGHVTVEDFVILGGLSAVHQFVRLGAHSFVGGMTGIENDLIPYGMAIGARGGLAGLNVIGLKRQGFDREQIHTLRKAYRMLFSNEGTLAERIDDVENMFGSDAGVAKVISFVRADSDRSLCVPRSN